MKFQILSIVFLTFSKIKSDDTETESLEDIYDNIRDIYGNYFNAEDNFLDATKWEEWTKPIDLCTRDTIAKKYDFIIVGAGSSGSVIANRLSEEPTWRILLLEAGKGENSFSQVPLAAPTLAFTNYNWNHIAQYQPNMSQGFENHRMLWPRGKALGGTSVINYMIYTRGNKLDYDRWRAPGWSYREVLPYFIKSENAKLQNSDTQFHGRNGYLSVENVYQSPLVQSFIEGGNELGLPFFDYNANIKSFGVSPIQATVLRGRRHSVAKAFLQPIRHRSNLHILTSAFVTKILIDPVTKKAYGVEYERFGKKYKVGTTKEVILSAGTFNSPQLLMLAGIGPQNHLQELGIPVIQDLPVGQGLQDHLTFPGMSFLINKDWSLSLAKLLNPSNIFNFLLNGTGPYTSLGGAAAISYIKTEVSKEVEDIPDIELLFIDGSLNTDYGLFSRRWMNIRDDVYNAVWAPTHNIPSWTTFPMLLHPKSKGFLKLQSKDPHVYPLLYGNYYSDPEQQDINTMLAAIRFTQKLAKTKPFRRIGSILNTNPLPDCAKYQFDSDDYWRCALRAISVTLHHQIGTVKMGPPNDPAAVVNHELKVYGIERLRVADSSVVPSAVGSHTNSVAIMIGEKISDVIKDDWKNQNLSSF